MGRTGALRKSKGEIPAPDAVRALIACLGESLHRHEIDVPHTPDDEWWIDLWMEGFLTHVVWHAEGGYGLYTTSGYLYGREPDETYAEPGEAARRLSEMFRKAEASGLF